MRPHTIRILALCSLFIATLAPSGFGTAQVEPGSSQWVTEQTIEVAGETVEYDAIVGSIVLPSDNDEPAVPVLYRPGIY